MSVAVPGAAALRRVVRDVLLRMAAALDGPTPAAADEAPPPDAAVGGPPAHWVARVRAGAPQLLRGEEGTHLVRPLVRPRPSVSRSRARFEVALDDDSARPACKQGDTSVRPANGPERSRPDVRLESPPQRSKADDAQEEQRTPSSPRDVMETAALHSAASQTRRPETPRSERAPRFLPTSDVSEPALRTPSPRLEQADGQSQTHDQNRPARSSAEEIGNESTVSRPLDAQRDDVRAKKLTPSQEQQPIATSSGRNPGIEITSPLEPRTLYAIDASTHDDDVPKAAGIVQHDHDDPVGWSSRRDSWSETIDPLPARQPGAESRPPRAVDREPEPPHKLSSWLTTWPPLDETAQRRQRNIDDSSRPATRMSTVVESNEQPARDDRWPELPDLPAFATLLDGDDRERATRLQRLDDEQRGVSWSA